MPSKAIKDILSKIAARVTGRPKPPELPKRPNIFGTGPGGHRGIAAGNLTPGKQDISAENIAKWRMLPDEESKAFFFDQQPVFVHSTNVAMAQFFREEGKMLVEYKGGSAYLYSGVTEGEAIQFLQSQSKGGFIWDTFRVRGSKTRHKKPYIRLR